MPLGPAQLALFLLTLNGLYHKRCIDQTQLSISTNHYIVYANEAPAELPQTKADKELSKPASSSVSSSRNRVIIGWIGSIRFSSSGYSVNR